MKHLSQSIRLALAAAAAVAAVAAGAAGVTQVQGTTDAPTAQDTGW